MRKLCLLIGLVFSASAIATESLQPDAKTFTRFELYSYLAEHTQLWDKGSVFYSDAGTLQAQWQGKCAKGKWSTTEEGKLCRHVTAWGEDSCETYYHNGDVVSMVKDATTSRAPAVEEGNTIDCQPLDLVMSLARGSDAVEFKGLFTREQTIAFLAGKTVVWGPGQGIYYAPDLTLSKIWGGVQAQGTWSVNDKGAVCWHIPGWGPTPCQSYYYKGEALMSVFNGKHDKASEHLAGNQIGTF